MREWLSHCIGNAGRIIVAVVAVAIPTVLLLTHVWYQFRITRLGYQISEQTDRHEKLADQHRKLKIEATVEGRADRLTQMAKRRFGLEPVEPEQIITVRPGPTREAKASRGAGSGESLDATEHAALEQERAQ